MSKVTSWQCQHGGQDSNLRPPSHKPDAIATGLSTHPKLLLQPFYDSLDFVQDNPGEPVPEGTFHHLLDFLVQNEVTQADAPTIWMDCHPIHTNWYPHLYHPHHFYVGCPSWHMVTQPSQFILAWDRHQICWLAYPLAWFNTPKM